MSGTRRTGPLIAYVEDEEFWKTAMFGIWMLVFDVDDDVWHERMLVRRVGAPGCGSG